MVLAPVSGCGEVEKVGAGVRHEGVNLIHPIVDLLGFGVSEQGLTCCAVDDVLCVIFWVEVPPVLVELKQETFSVCDTCDGCAVVHDLAPNKVVNKDFQDVNARQLVKVSV